MGAVFVCIAGAVIGFMILGPIGAIIGVVCGLAMAAKG